MNEVCPSCGDFVDTLNEYTGWCKDCDARLVLSKPCIKCGETKPVADNFYRHRLCKDGYRNTCKACNTLERREWRQANLDRDNENWRRGYYRRKASIPA